MSSDEKRVARRAPVVLRIKLRYESVDNFIQKFATNLSPGGMFISTRTPKPPGTEIKFELRLADDSQLIAGTGVVRWVQEYDPDNPRRVHGMGVEFTDLDDDSRELVARVIAHKRSLGLPDEQGIPLTPRRAQVRPPAPAAPAPSSSVLSTSDEPAPVAPPPRMPPPPPELPARKPRVAVADLLARAASPPAAPAAAPDLDGLDLAASELTGVLARARNLAGEHGADGELDELLRVSAAPVAESVDDASGALAAITGGAPIVARKRRPRGSEPPEPLAAPEPPTPTLPPLRGERERERRVDGPPTPTLPPLRGERERERRVDGPPTRTLPPLHGESGRERGPDGPPTPTLPSLRDDREVERGVDDVDDPEALATMDAVPEPLPDLPYAAALAGEPLSDLEEPARIAAAPPPVFDEAAAEVARASSAAEPLDLAALGLEDDRTGVEPVPMDSGLPPLPVDLDDPGDLTLPPPAVDADPLTGLDVDALEPERLLASDLEQLTPGKRRAAARDLPEMAPDLSAFADPPDTRTSADPPPAAATGGGGEGDMEEIDAALAALDIDLVPIEEDDEDDDDAATVARNRSAEELSLLAGRPPPRPGPVARPAAPAEDSGDQDLDELDDLHVEVDYDGFTPRPVEQVEVARKKKKAEAAVETAPPPEAAPESPDDGGDGKGKKGIFSRVFGRKKP